MVWVRTPSGMHYPPQPPHPLKGTDSFLVASSCAVFVALCVKGHSHHINKSVVLYILHQLYGHTTLAIVIVKCEGMVLGVEGH